MVTDTNLDVDDCSEYEEEYTDERRDCEDFPENICVGIQTRAETGILNKFSSV